MVALGDTGGKVCARAGKKCVGNTDFTLTSCLASPHGPDAIATIVIGT
jgi:hypothetical protein